MAKLDFLNRMPDLGPRPKPAEPIGPIDRLNGRRDPVDRNGGAGSAPLPHVEIPPGQRALESAIMSKLPSVDITHPEETPQDGRMAAVALAMRAAKLLNDIDGAFEVMERAFLDLKAKRDRFAERIENEGMELVELAQKQTALMARASARIDRLMEDDDDDGATPRTTTFTGENAGASPGSSGVPSPVVRGVAGERPRDGEG